MWVQTPLVLNLIKPLEENMSRDEREDHTIYKVVVNHEEQYSIWPATARTRSAGTTSANPAPRQNASPT